MIKIDKNIPIPQKWADNDPIYPFADMEVGDSFLFEGKRNTLCTATYKYSQRSGRKFSSRKVEGGFRVWRVA